MGFSSLHVCMESSDHWLQGTIQEESGIDSCSPSADMLTCSRSMMEKGLKPPQDQALIKCPRCDSTHTKFCYYNNYSLSQPRYFCKTCRRYWTKGGTLRNIPVGGGCRKNKKVSTKKPNGQSAINQNQTQPGVVPSNYHHNPKDLQLPFPADVQFSHLNNLLGANAGALGNPNFMESKYNNNNNNNNNNNMGMVENPRPSDFMVVSSRNFDFFGNSDMGVMGVGLGDHVNGYNGLMPTNNYQGLCFGGMSLDGNNGGTYQMDTCQRLMLPYDNQNGSIDDVKPNPKLLSLEWQDQGCSDAGKEQFGYPNGPGSWNGVMNGYGSSTKNPLV